MPAQRGEFAEQWHARAQHEYLYAQEMLVAHLARVGPAELADAARAGRVGDPLCWAAFERAAAAFTDLYEATAAVVSEPPSLPRTRRHRDVSQLPGKSARP